jgi:hypothetical protein
MEDQVCCEYGNIGRPHACAKALTAAICDGCREYHEDIVMHLGSCPKRVNGAGIELSKLHQSPGRPRGKRGPLNAKHPSSLARRLKKHGVDWVEYFAEAVKACRLKPSPPSAKAQARRDVTMWLKLLPYLVTTHNMVKVKKCKGKPSKAAIMALNALEGK